MTPPKRIALIGHRGVGKTSLLLRIEKFYKSVKRRARTFDLDKEIEQVAGRTISKIFDEDGEAVFRRLEHATLEKIEKEIQRTTDDVYVALGAGFAVSQIPSHWRTLWVRRPSDEAGRIFLDRPRLEPSITQLEEYKKRYAERTPKFSERADSVLWIDEGIEDNSDESEKDYFLGSLRELGGALTVTSENLRRDFTAWREWADERVAWGLRWFELRDDLLSEEAMSLVAKSIPRDRLLVSFRDTLREKQTVEFVREQNVGAIDWPVERGAIPASISVSEVFLSTHKKSVSIEASLSQLSQAGEKSSVKLKAALPVENFRELMLGYQWQLADPNRRVFLPMSQDGRWAWYRLFTGSSAPLAFLRESSGSTPDQPTLLQWVRRQKNKSSMFAAVLGDPVSHSRTPLEQSSFFAMLSESVFAIRVTEQEIRDGAFKDLAKLGLRFAAVTAPLKKAAFASLPENAVDSDASLLQSINTMTFSSEGPAAGANTDLAGLRKVAGDLSAKKIAVWGGGGTLDVLRQVFPNADLYSVRSGELRQGGQGAKPDLVIWAAGLTNETPLPPRDWTPKIIFDLNYAESSIARAYALSVKARYISGLEMFRAQAAAQREFWAKGNLKNPGVEV